MKRLLPNSLGGQLLVLLLAALVLSQALAFLVFSGERQQAMRSVRQFELLERTAAMVRVLEATPPERHDEILRAVGSPRLRLWISEDSALAAAYEGEHAEWLAGVLEGMLPAAPREPVRVALTGEPVEGGRWHDRRVRRHMAEIDDDDDDDDDDEERLRPGRGEHHERMHFGAWRPGDGTIRMGLTISTPLSDGGWLNVATRLWLPPVGWAWPSVAAMLLAAAMILAIVVLTVRRITRPLTALSAAAERLGRGEDVKALDAEGPSEVRRTTEAFNAMQERLGRFVRDRTAMLAAISHDLRTPITALRLRAELVEDEENKARLLALIEEMQEMTEATLAFAREESKREETRLVDLAALVESLCDDLREMGNEVTFAGAGRTPYPCRPVSLKRALRNLAENAVAYGQRARVALESGAAGIAIRIDDDGPGIPEADLDRVFGPFVRLEESRSRETGGIGLGLAIARSIVRGHGGDVTLENRREGGLRATVRLPAAVAEPKA